MRAGLLVLIVAVSAPSITVHGQTTDAPEATLTAVSTNVAEPGQPVRIRIFRWSTDRDRSPILAALEPLPPPTARSGGERGGAGRAGRAGGRGARGRGATAAPPPTPDQLLAGAIRRAETIGYIWTNDVTGYAIKYAFRAPTSDGGQRIILASDRRLGTHSPAWDPVSPSGAEAGAKAALNDYEFTLIELRLDAKGRGEGRTSLTTKVLVDKEAGTLALDNYASAPPILKDVKR
jgi:hypothetical protein